MPITANDTSNREIIITRTVNAPRSLVWDVWTQPEHVKNWWGPDGFTNTIHEMEVKPGGVWRFLMHGPNGMDFPNRIVFNEVVKPSKLVYTHSSEDPKDPNVFVSTITFEEIGQQTRITMRGVFPTAEERDRVVKEYGAIEGGQQSLRRLSAYLSTLDGAAFTLERLMNAPTEKVWKALTDSSEMKKWYFDIPGFRATPGFRFQFTGQGHKGDIYLHHCTVLEVIPGHKLVHSWTYEDQPGYSVLTWELFPEGEKTRLVLTHEGLESFPRDNPDFATDSFRKGWNQLVTESLAAYLAGSQSSIN